MQLSSRATQIIRILLRVPYPHPVNASAISEELGISRRSVQRELSLVEEWLASYGYHLLRKPGTGLLLDETPERRTELGRLLEQAGDSHTPRNRTQRQKQLYRELLAAKDPIKANYFTNKYKISTGTLFSDLEQVAKMFQKYQLTLIRRPGVGIFIEGSSAQRQLAISSVICEELTEQQLLSMLRTGKHAAQSVRIPLFNDVDADILAETETALENCEKKLGVSFSDSGFLGLYVHISLALQRLRKGEPITIEAEKLQKLALLPEYVVAKQMIQSLSQSLKMDIPSDEVGFVTMHLSSARVWPEPSGELTPTRTINIRQTTLAIIDIVGAELHRNFRTDESLIDDLCNHMKPTIGRLRAGIPIDNPQLEYMQNDYADIYRACEKSSSVLCELLQLEHIPPSEIGFIAMHFGAAIERRQTQMQRIRVIIVCPTGIGTSRLLAAGLQREYANLDIRGVLSAFQLDSQKLKQDGIDLIISTVSLNIDYRYVQVSPILTVNDKMMLGTAMDRLLTEKKDTPAPISAPAKSLTRDEVTFISSLGEEIFALLEHLAFLAIPTISHRDDLFHLAASLFSTNASSQASLTHLFRQRDQLASTYIQPFSTLLLHGKTPLVEHACFGYVQINTPALEDDQPLLGAIVMLIPDHGPSAVCAQIMSEVSGLLLENASLLMALRSGNLPELKQLLETLLLQFYQRTLQNLLSST